MKQNITPLRKITFLSLAFLLLASSFAFSQDVRKINTRDHSILMTAEAVDGENPSITVSWAKNELALGYEIRRKLITDDQFPSNPLQTFDTTTTSYTDNNVEKGKLYEYEVRSLSYGSVVLRFTKDGNTFDSTVARHFYAYGFICAGVKAPPKDILGTVLLLVDETVAQALPDELDRLTVQLILEGWKPIMKTVPRQEEFDGQAVKDVKAIISAEHMNDPALNTVMIIGRVAVPYSGRIYPDGHGDHIGAWPADLYYGYLNEMDFTDYLVNDVSARRDANKNVNGDGKFDMSTFNYGNVDLRVGRIDFYNMPAFEDSEMELIKKYLDKDYAYRTGQMAIEFKGLVDDNFGASRYTEGFGSSGWRNLGSLLGPENVKSMDWFDNLKTDSHLWAYGCGGGSYTSCGGIGRTIDTDTNKADENKKDFVHRQVNAVFTMLFGSYFGDWDSKNNFLRASLCSEPSILTCSWTGRPPWYYHHMAMGFPIGYSTLLSQNNYTEYVPHVYYFNGLSGQPTISVTGLKTIHVALMGDPTLRMYMATIPQPTNLSVVQPDGGFVEISWDIPSEITGEYYFNVYSSVDPAGPFTRLNDEPLMDTEFTDENLYEGEVFYMVRTIAPQISNTGIFWNISDGEMKSAIITDVEKAGNLQFDLICSPNPAYREANISVTLPEAANIEIDVFDATGNLISIVSSARAFSAGTHNIAWGLTDKRGTKVPAGVYFISAKAGKYSDMRKLIVMP